MTQLYMQDASGTRRVPVEASAFPTWEARGWRLLDPNAPAPAPEATEEAQQDDGGASATPTELRASHASVQPSDVTGPGQSKKDDETVHEQGEE